MPTNPYTPGQVPRILAGRTVEMRRIEGALGATAYHGRELIIDYPNALATLR